MNSELQKNPSPNLSEPVPAGISDARLEIHLNTKEPIELIDLTISFQALAFQYKRHLSKHLQEKGQQADDADVKLFITKIESGSVFAELGSAALIMGQLFSIMDYTNIYIEFIRNIGHGIDYFRALTDNNKIDPKEIKYTKAECRRFEDLLDVAAKSKDADFSISAIEYSSSDEKQNKKVHLKINYTSEQAYKAKQGTLLAQKYLDYKGESDYKKVLMYFYQTNIDDPKASGRTSDKVVIKTVLDRPLPVYFVSELDRQKIRRILDDPNENPFKMSFVVDVNVETDRKEIPTFYRVINVSEIIREEGDSEP